MKLDIKNNQWEITVSASEARNLEKIYDFAEKLTNVVGNPYRNDAEHLREATAQLLVKIVAKQPDVVKFLNTSTPTWADGCIEKTASGQGGDPEAVPEEDDQLLLQEEEDGSEDL